MLSITNGRFHLADYYPLIARAIAGLDPSAPGESRRALYERARAALTAQLRSVLPSLSESEITRERLSLEEAVRKVEAEAAQRARDMARRPPTEDTFRTRAALEENRRQALDANAKREAQAEQARREEEERLEGERQRRLLEEQQAQVELAWQQKAEEARLEEQHQQLDEIERATLAQDQARRQRQEQETARVQKDVRRRVVRAELAKVASPTPLLAQDGRLDAGPNAIYDESNGSDDLVTLPIRQRAIIKTILSDLPGNSPRYLKSSLESYDDELKVRGAQPILGLLKDIFDIIEAAVVDPRAQQEWLELGLRKAFERLAENHLTLVKHFPLDPEREELYARTSVEENEATGSSLSEPFKDVAEAARDANKAGLTTDDFLRVIDKMAEFAKIISTIPPSQPSLNPRHKLPSNDVEAISVRSEDRISDNDRPISPKKRILLSGFGFFERVYNLVGSTVTIGGTPEGIALLFALREAIGALSKFLS
jgi:hypothetical protein